MGQVTSASAQMSLVLSKGGVPRGVAAACEEFQHAVDDGFGALRCVENCF